MSEKYNTFTSDLANASEVFASEQLANASAAEVAAQVRNFIVGVKAMKDSADLFTEDFGKIQQVKKALDASTSLCNTLRSEAKGDVTVHQQQFYSDVLRPALASLQKILVTHQEPLVDAQAQYDGVVMIVKTYEDNLVQTALHQRGSVTADDLDLADVAAGKKACAEQCATAEEVEPVDLDATAAVEAADTAATAEPTADAVDAEQATTQTSSDQRKE